MKQKTIIVLHETANQGKSMTLSELGRILFKNKATTKDEINKSEYRAILTYKNCQIGIQTYGDNEWLIMEGLDALKKCDIIVIPAKRFGATHTTLNQFANKQSYRVIWAAPYKVWDGSIGVDEIKRYSASHIKFMIDDIISNNL